MDFLKKLLGSSAKAPPPQPAAPDDVELRGNGKFALPVVGESRYQDNLETICGERTGDGEDRIVDALLVMEDDNPYDRGNAVKVTISGKTVGYLAKDVASAYRQTMKQAGHPKAIATCKARIRGGWKRKNGNLGSYGVTLDVPFEVE